MADNKPKWNQPNGYHPHKTPSGAFDPEVFALPEMENLGPIDESGIILKRTESLGLKCLADRPLLHAQMSTDSVFSRVTEGETMEPPDEDTSQENLESGAVSVASIPIGIRCPTGPVQGHVGSDEVVSHSAPGAPYAPTHAVPDDLITEPFSMTSLPDRLACEETVNSMTAAVLQDDECQEQIQANNLFQMVNQGTAQILLVPSNQFAQSPMYPVNAAQVANAQMNVLYKTELCRSWQFGTCRYADRCLFAHGEHELRPLQRPRHNKYKTELCITYHSFGICPYASRCNFVHEMGEHRPAKHSVPSLYKTRLCRTFMERASCPYGDKCDFAHGTNDLSYDITKHPKYRTKLCRSFQETGSCIYGDRCCFSHSLPRSEPEMQPNQLVNQPEPESVITLQNKTGPQPSNENPTISKHQENNQAKKQVCRRWKFTGKCPFGKHCIFSHNSTTGKMAEKRTTPRG